MEDKTPSAYEGVDDGQICMHCEQLMADMLSANGCFFYFALFPKIPPMISAADLTTMAILTGADSKSG
ncbi:hypothetical protein CEXT_674651 [Caerostris extrusa]|uniref:Uncharacterized protein n=1 Tax=Caerostris extrusa TaxID=172846 RepID=A0AAV4N9E5_CAEEX|nr:hypothetical protein CEXT_674651 [Caerostris extrusa]